MTAPLDRLHDFYQPPPPSWKPQTLGWYVAFAIIALLLGWLAAHLFRRWSENRYRREALNEIANVEATQLSALLKRAALCSWPRETIAMLTGPAWLKFLDDTMQKPLFESAPANRIEELALSPSKLSAEEAAAIRYASARWIKYHKPLRRQRRPHVPA